MPAVELSASAVQQSRVFVYVGVRLWERRGVPGGTLCPPPFRQAALFRIAGERHGLLLDLDLEKERERERLRDGEGTLSAIGKQSESMQLSTTRSFHENSRICTVSLCLVQGFVFSKYLFFLFHALIIRR